MTGIAAGLALSGKIVFTYSIANFPTLRCLEQIRNDVCHHSANVVVVAVGGGYSYGALGMTHHATEDLAIMRVLPHMTVIAPGDPDGGRRGHPGRGRRHRTGLSPPGPHKEPVVHQRPIALVGRQGDHGSPGGDVTLITTGAMLAQHASTPPTMLARKRHRRARC